MLSATAYSINTVNNLEIYGNVCNANSDVSAALQVDNNDCFGIYDVQNAQIGAPGAGRNYLAGR